MSFTLSAPFTSRQFPVIFFVLCHIFPYSLLSVFTYTSIIVMSSSSSHWGYTLQSAWGTCRQNCLVFKGDADTLKSKIIEDIGLFVGVGVFTIEKNPIFEQPPHAPLSLNEQVWMAKFRRKECLFFAWNRWCHPSLSLAESSYLT